MSYILILFLFLVHSRQFTKQTYKDIVSNSVKPESRIQQVTAIPTRSYNNVTYTTSKNDYVHVTTSGAVLWKGHFPEGNLKTRNKIQYIQMYLPQPRVFIQCQADILVIDFSSFKNAM